MGIINEECENKIISDMKKVTMKMIADRAGVSLSCVTRCVNGTGYVSDEKKQKVFRVMEELNYIPNQQAKCLRQGHSKLFGHIYMATDENIFFTMLATRIERKSFKKGYKIISYALNEGDAQKLDNILNDLLSYGVDGIIFNCGKAREIVDGIGKKVKKMSIPIVMIERPADVYEIEKILVDNAEGSYVATKNLSIMGHKKIAYLGVNQVEIVEQERYYGYVQAMKDIDYEYAQNHSYFVENYTVENGYRKTLEILEKNNELPTAIFAASDILAAGVYRALTEKNVKIPDKISVVGYDDTIAKFLSPPLSTMQLPVEEIAEMAVEVLIDKIEGKGQQLTNRTVKLGPVFVERESIKNIGT